MKNPWINIPTQSPYVLSHEADILKECNTKFTDDFQIKTDMYPEPFIGNVNAPIYLLNLNPGFDKRDPIWHSNNNFISAIKSNLIHEPMDYPFYFLNPMFKETPGAEWWSKKLNHLISDTTLDTVAKNIFCVEFFPYHSKKYRDIPKGISSELLNSQRYSMYLVEEALKRNVHVIIMRSSKKWFGAISELLSTKNVYRLKNPQNVYVSPNNLNGYHDIVEILKQC